MNLDRRLLKEARRAALWLALTVGLGLLGGAATLFQALYLSRAITRVFLDGASLEQVQPLLLLLLLAIVARAVAVGAREVTASRAAVRIKSALRERLFAHLLALGPAFASGARAGELANTLDEGIESLDAYFSQYLPNLALAALIPLTILAFVFPLDPLSGLVFLLTAPLIPLFMVLIGKMAEALTRRQWGTLSLLSGRFLDVLQGLTTLKLFGHSRTEVQLLGQASDRFRVTTLGVLRVALLSALALELLSTLGTAVVAVEVGLRLLYGSLPFQQALFILILAPEFYLPLRNLGTGFHAGIAGMAAAGRIHEILGVPDGETGMRGDERDVRDRDDSVRDFVSFEDVHLAYDGGERPALRGVTFEIARGEHVALVGPSGAGKSSIAQLLLGFIRANRGRVLVDGRPIGESGMEEWRRGVAWVPQAPHLFHATVAENLRLARPGATREQLIQAARQAGAHEFILGLPHGYDTVIGERGERLSGGQAQRLALARALLKDAPFLILDEATSHLDPEQEASLQEAIGRLAEGRTVLSIAHRLGAARGADRVLVLEEGRVVAEGSHAELLRRDGLYRRLVEAHGEDESGRGTTEWAPSAPSNLDPATDFGMSMQGLPYDRPAPAGWRTLLRLLRLASPFTGRMALSALLGFATVGSAVGLMATAALLIALAALHPSVADLSVAIVGVRFFGLSRGVLRYLERYISHDVTFRLLAHLRVWLFRAIEPRPPAWTVQQRSGDLLNRVVADVETLQHFYGRVIAPPVVAILAGAAMLFFLSGFDPSLARVLATFLLTSGVAVPVLTLLASRGLGQEATRLRGELSVRLVDGLQGIAELLAFGQGERQLDQVRQLSRRWLAIQGKMGLVTGLHSGVSALLANMGMWAVLVAAIPLVAGGRLEGIYLPVVTLAALAGFEAVAPLPAAFQQLGSCLEAARRLFEIVDGDQGQGIRGRGDGGTGRGEDARKGPESRVETSPGSRVPSAGEGPSPAPRAQHSGPGTHTPEPGTQSPAPDLVVERLRFRYGPSEPLVLDGVSFRLPAGGSLALVGPSGSGKSTLINLLLRFWDYQDGRITLWGRELRDLDREELLRGIAVVPQRVHLFNGTLRENLLLGRPGADDQQLWHAVELARLDLLVKRLPRGYETPVGELGLRLSGGERQRVAIARALLKDAPFLILDEPTVNLDGPTEREVLRSLANLMESRTTLLVTHRPAGLEMVDRVLVLEGGRIADFAPTRPRSVAATTA